MLDDTGLIKNQDNEVRNKTERILMSCGSNMGNKAPKAEILKEERSTSQSSHEEDGKTDQNFHQLHSAKEKKNSEDKSKKEKRSSIEVNLSPKGKNKKSHAYDTSSNVVEKYQDDKREDFEFFWKPRDILSQWFPCKFFINGTEYNCAEQYMMQQKALILGDNMMAELIMALDEPKEQKELARTVVSREDNPERYASWNMCCFEVVKRGNIAKFSQNKGLKMALFSTYPKILAEASPTDMKWGIGLEASNHKAWNRATWRGKNILGQILMEVREELMKDDGIL